MYDLIIEKIKKILSMRLIYLILAVIVMFSILAVRMYDIQILNRDTDIDALASTGDAYKTSQKRFEDSTRGNIYDRNGNLLAYNVQSYNIVMGNSARMTKNAERNAMIEDLIDIIESHGYELELDFPIILKEDGTLAFTVSGNSELRFKKNAYGLTAVSKLSDQQRNASAAEVYSFLKDGDIYSPMFGISDDLPTEKILKIMAVRYELFTLYPQYSQFTLCSDVDDVTIAAIMENAAELPGVEIKQVTSRVYNDSIYFAHVLGYTGTASEDEAEALNSGLEEPIYSTSDIVGKTGIEKEMDSVLRGTKGELQLAVNSSGKVISTRQVSDPHAGKDIYLTIDREIQICCYHILENNISAILRSKIVNSMDYGAKGVNAQKMTIPIYEVYDAFFSNKIFNTDHFRAADATSLEQHIYSSYLNRKQTAFARLEDILSYSSPTPNFELNEEMSGYIDYIYSRLRTDGVISKTLVDTSDPVYRQYVLGNISLSALLVHAIDMKWINLSKIGIGTDYYTNAETYAMVLDYIFDMLDTDDEFERMIYRVLIFSYEISGKDVCLLLFDQGILEHNDNDYRKLENNSVTPYKFILDKLETLEITPAMLALEPCSGSVVITDVNTGELRALVSYPSYDNNMLANKIDWEYYQGLLNNKSTPLMPRATQQLLSTGSTIKPLMALAGMGEGVINPTTKIYDEYVFDKVDPAPKCLRAHGTLNVTQAIQYSCNYFFYEVGYRLSCDFAGNPVDSLGISKIQKYATMFGLASKAGVEVPEAMPSVSSRDAVRSAIGYYHSFTPLQIARYITAIANRGTVYNFTLVDKIVDKEQNTVVNNHATVYNKIDMYSDAEWNAVHRGMSDVVNTSANSLDTIFGDLGFLVAGKTGTAQVSVTHPSHTLFLSFAPYEDPDISVTVVIPNGYKSANPAKLCREVYGLYYNDEHKEELLSGDLTTTDVTSVVVAD